MPTFATLLVFGIILIFIAMTLVVLIADVPPAQADDPAPVAEEPSYDPELH